MKPGSDHLVARHTVDFGGPARGTLGKRVFERLRDYVVSHLDEPIEVATLAAMAGARTTSPACSPGPSG